MKIVVDTNVFVSSFLSPTGSPRQVIDLWKQGLVTLCLCAETLEEHLLVLARLGLQGEPEMDELLALIRRGINIRFVAIEGTLRVVADDPDDDPFVECAVTAGAEYIVSGDRHLAGRLSLGQSGTVAGAFVDTAVKSRGGQADRNQQDASRAVRCRSCKSLLQIIDST